MYNGGRQRGNSVRLCAQVEQMKKLIEADGFKIVKEKKMCLTITQVPSTPEC